jgi:hypothetical protein
MPLRVVKAVHVPLLCIGLLLIVATPTAAQTPGYTAPGQPAAPAMAPAPAAAPPAAPAPAAPAPAAPAPAQSTAPSPTQGQPAQASTGQMPGWSAGPEAILSDTYQGVVDAPTNGGSVPANGSFNVDGWFVDTTAQGWAGADNVQVFLGPMGSGGTMLAQGIVGESRPDVGTALGNPYWANSGFFVQVPGSMVPAGSQTLNVYLHTPAKGWWFEPVNVNGGTATTPAAVAATAGGPPQVTVTDPTENQNISTRNGDHTITGTATVPSLGSSDIDRIEVWIDGERNSGSLLGTTTMMGDGTWSLTFTPTHFASTHSNLYIYAHSKSTGQETEFVRGFNITDQ